MKTLRKFTFDSLDAFVREAGKPANTCYARPAATDTYSDGWAGTATFGEAVDLARNGWAEGRELFVSAVAAAAPVTQRVAEYTMDVAGAYPVAALAAAGDPGCMVNPTPSDSRSKPVVRLVLNRCASASYSADEFRSYGAAVASYIDSLEAAGYRIEIDAAMFAVDSKQREYYCSVIVKQAHEPMELDRMAFVLTHPSYLRRLHFGVAQNREDDDDSMSYCGTPLNPEPRHVEQGQLILPGINIFKPRSDALKSPAAAAEALAPVVAQMLSESGINPPELAFGGKHT